MIDAYNKLNNEINSFFLTNAIRHERHKIIYMSACDNHLSNNTFNDLEETIIDVKTQDKGGLRLTCI